MVLYKEFKNSIKSYDTEEKLDLVLYRPAGFLIAKVSSLFLLTPTMLSLLGLACGILASYYYLNSHNQSSLILGSLYFVLSGIFDSADGQLARITNQSTKLGLILDGICDSIVTIFIYAACSWKFVELYGPFFILIVCTGLYLHSCQCAILDFYHREYLYFGYGKTENDTYWNPGIEDGMLLVKNSAGIKERIMNGLRLTWIKKQQGLTSRSDSLRQAMRRTLLNATDEKREIFMKIYRQNNLWILSFWRLIGVNAHTVLAIAFIFLGRFDIYIVAFDIIVLNLIILAVGNVQRKADEKLFLALEPIVHDR
ncbi:MAG: CDP-alcohol phosphatidyltransferase family protein [Bacteriovorax sp.]